MRIEEIRSRIDEKIAARAMPDEDREAIGRVFDAVLQRLSEPNATGEAVRDAAAAVCAEPLLAARAAIDAPRGDEREVAQ